MEYFIFDLDGTITNSEKGIINSVRYALNYFGIEKDFETLRKFIGPPLESSFIKFANLSKDEAIVAVGKYREYYSPKGIFENELYEGIIEFLEFLKEREKKVILATSKPWIYAEIILEHFNIKKYFDFVGGSELNGVRTNKGEVIEYVIRKCQIDVKKAYMIGDRKHDIIGGRENKVETIGVLYGFGDKKELEEAGANHIVEDVKGLYKFV